MTRTFTGVAGVGLLRWPDMVDALETAADPLQLSEATAALSQPVLTVAHHPRAEHIGRRVVIDSALALGRGADTLGAGVLDDDLLSRQHVQIERRGDVVTARDLGSRNGTFVNRKRIERVTLRDGDVLGLGALLLVVGRAPADLSPMSDPLLAGVSAPLCRLLADVHVVAAQDVTVLIRGETGVGKELVAQRIHQLSGKRGSFVGVNCGGLGDGVVGSELFGHVRGAFSGADGDRKGLVESAAGGTLLLDEIGDASPQVQTSLLRLLQDRVYRPVGSDTERKSDARFIAATHVRLDAAVVDGRFRQDLLARLRRWVITVPPLRERREDILPIAMKIASERLGRTATIERALAAALLTASWPDNVRGLAGILDNALVDAQDGIVPLTPRVQARLDEMEASTASVDDEPSEQAAFRKQRPDAAYLTRRLTELEGNVKALATELSISRNTLYRWLRDHNIDPTTLR